MLNDEQVKNVVDKLKYSDMSYTEIAKQHNISKVAVRYWAERLKDTGIEIPERKRGKKPKAL